MKIENGLGWDTNECGMRKECVEAIFYKRSFELQQIKPID